MASSAIQSSHSVMSLFLNIVLLVVGTIATAVAFGGDTWKKGRESLLRRITWRGWVSLASLLVALCAGIAKELLTKSQDAEKDRRISELQTIVATTHRDMREQNNAIMIAAFANADLKLKDILFFLPLTNKANDAEVFRGAFLPKFDVDLCRRKTNVEVDVATNSLQPEVITYPLDDVAYYHKRYTDPVPKADSFRTFDELDELYLISEDKEEAERTIPQKELVRRNAYNLQIRVEQKSIAAAELYPIYANPNGGAVVIEARWPLQDSNYPQACVDALQKYFASAFDKAVVILMLDNKQNETIAFKMKAHPPVRSTFSDGTGQYNTLYVAFGNYSSPLIGGSYVDPQTTPDFPDTSAKKKPR